MIQRLRIRATRTNHTGVKRTLLMQARWKDGLVEEWNVANETSPHGPESIIPIFQYSIIPFVSEAN
jgi:hypothetical protein